MIRPELFDTVELLIDLPAQQLRAGAQGAIVQAYNDDAFEVEFSDDAGQTLALCALSPAQFIVIWRNANHAWVTPDEQAAQLVSRLREPESREVIDFARYLHVRRARSTAPSLLAEP
jgi:hypothetical protein